MNQFNLMFECENCKQKFLFNNENASLNYQKEFSINGQSIFLTYYDCPTCGKRHFVQIDDIKSKQMLVCVTTMFTKLAVAKKKGKEISKKQSEKFKKARRDLSNYRMNLMKEYADEAVMIDEKMYFLRFSV